MICAAMLAALAWGAQASAQTTVTLDQPTNEVVFVTLRGGSYANTNLSTVLETRAAENLQYERRALLKFDTQNQIPVGSAVTSALLTVTVKNGSADATRRVAAYQVRTSWNEKQATWNVRRTGERWTTAGGDLGSQIAVQTVGNAAGTKVTFNITALVKAAVSGQLGTSRYTRVALVDLDGSTSDSYRSYYTPADANTANRPVLRVIYGGLNKITIPPPVSPSPPPISGSSLRVMHWNTHHGGVGTDGVWDPERLMKWVAKINPDIVSLNEVESSTHGVNGPADLTARLERLTGRNWHYKFLANNGTSSGTGDMILSRFPFDAVGTHILSYNRVIINAAITVNGRTIDFFSTHLDQNATSYRLREIGELTGWATNIAQQRIIAGDFNAWPGSTETATMKQTYYDSWAEAQADGTDMAYPGNTVGNTRNSRIDYIYYSHGATNLVLKSMQVFDTRDARGVMPSDHRPIEAIYTVK
jgi:endonuclease/exonuclease/phosphatase family metal-dependent hydrolase